MYVLFFALPLRAFQTVQQHQKLTKDMFGNGDAVVLKSSQADAALAAHDAFVARSVIDDVVYVIAMITITDEVWDRWAHAGLCQETNWLKRPGWRVYTDIHVSDGVGITELTRITWSGDVKINVARLSLES